jgi:hypothetical protein
MITCDGCNVCLGPSYNERFHTPAKPLIVNQYVEVGPCEIQRQEITAELCNVCYIRATNLMAATFGDFLNFGARKAMETDIAKAEQLGHDKADIEWQEKLRELVVWAKKRKAAKWARFPLSTTYVVETPFDEVIAKLSEMLRK